MSNSELSEEDKRTFQKHRELEIQGEEKERLFWIEVYPNFSIDNKVKYWVSNINHGMRMQGGATNDPYSEFSVEWYEYVKAKESDFDFIFGKVVPRLGIDLNWDEYYKRINKSI